MNAFIQEHVTFAQQEIKKITNDTLQMDRAFSHLILKYRFDVDYYDQIGLVTDGPNDGGIDFLYYDEEDSKVVLCQSKFTDKLSFNDIIAELKKMHSTVQDFKKSNTGVYNDTLKRALQNAIDRLPEENPDNFEYYIFTTAPINVDQAKRKVQNNCSFYESVSIVTDDQIEKFIQQSLELLDTVESAKVQIDKPRNYLEYESDDSKGIMCNVRSKSLISLYNNYAGNGLFDLNIRRYIRNRLVDDGIKKTLDNDRSNFWFLNNGVIIACEDYEPDGNTIKLTKFSIVNGGQTTTLIGTYKGTNTEDFYIPCKIVATKDDSKAESFFTKIAEATNSQKPIKARDLKSNTPEMVRLNKWLGNHDIYLEIKRGYKPKSKQNITIKNDELGQLILSFAFQRPGTSRSGKKVIFENQTIYDQLYKVDYEKDASKKSFILDLIDLKTRYDEIEKKLKTSGLNAEKYDVLKNGRQTIFALMGLCYRIVNNDVTATDISNKPLLWDPNSFIYGPLLSNYKSDDLDNKLESVIRSILHLLTDAYRTELKRNTAVISASNFMKTDQKYYTGIARYFTEMLDLQVGEHLLNSSIIFKRNSTAIQ